MPAPESNQYAAKPADEKSGDSFSLRAPVGIKGRAVKAARARKPASIKLTQWLIEAIEEKLEREGF